MKYIPKIVVVHVFWQNLDTSECLLIRQAKGKLQGNWQMVSGKVNDGEGIVSGALRELQEETGLKPSRFYSADFIESFFIPGIDEIFFAPVFVAFVKAKEPITLSKSEHDAYQWISIEKAMQHLEFSGQRRALEHIQEEFINKAPNPRLQINI